MKNNLNPVATYENAKLLKKQILQENKAKSGIYRWVNLINGKTYIGSGLNLSNRLSHYFSQKHMETSLKTSKSAIYSALIKHGCYNFSLEILEYCSVENLIQREQYFIDIMEPEYNILKTAGSRLGSNHSEESRAKISAAQKGKFNSMFGKTHDEEARAKMSTYKKGKNNPMFGRKGEKHHNFGRKDLGKPAQAIEVEDKYKNLKTTYESICAAARDLEVDMSIITSYFRRNQQKPYKGRYTFKKL
jgi:group I intron endonuclease